MVGALLGGIVMFAYLIYTTIQGKGNPKDAKSGIIKIALRQFQLTGIISQFPLAWSDEIKGMFSVFSAASNAGADVFSVDCFMQSNYTVNSLLNLAVPVVVLLFFLTGIAIKYGVTR